MRNILIFIFIISPFYLKSQVVSIKDSLVLDFLNEWIGVPYKFGGNTKLGIDCSQLNKKFYQSVYKINLPDICAKQYLVSKRIPKDSLKMGDLVFFRSSKSPSGWHCGCYLENGNFLHSPRRGDRVKISNLQEERYRMNYRGSGRVIKN